MFNDANKGTVRVVKDGWRVESRSSAAGTAACEHAQCLRTRPGTRQQRKLNRDKLSQRSRTTRQFSNPRQTSASLTAAASSLLSPILMRRGVCTPPIKAHAHKHICLLFIQPLLFHLHILCSALYVPEETAPYAPTDLLRTTFKLDVFTEELAEEREEKKEP